MTEHRLSPMKDSPEAWLRATAQSFRYPPTPDLVGAVRGSLPAQRARRRRRQLAWAAAALLVLFGGMMAVKPVRAAVVEIVRLGAVRIFLGGPTPTQPPEAVQMTELALAGELSLEEAEALIQTPITLPSYPKELGEPDGIFRIDVRRPSVVLVWLAEGSPDQIQHALFILPPGSLVTKTGPPRIESVSVHDEQAWWAVGDHLMLLGDSGQVRTRMVYANVLIWSRADLTYRLETRLPLDQAIRMAESMEH